MSGNDSYRVYHVPSLPDEIWKPVYGYEDYYEVSNLGRVKSLLREIETPNGYRYQDERIMKQALHRNNQKGKSHIWVVSLCVNSKRSSKTVHALVCEAFHGARPSPEHMALHLDGDVVNNISDNVYWGVIQDQIDIGLETGRYGFTKETIKEIKESKESITFLAEYYGLSRESVGRIKSGETWKSV